MKQEHWRPVRDFEGLYECSSEGNVRSLTRTREGSVFGRHDREYEGRVLKKSRDSDGYEIVSLTDSKRKNLAKVHRIVAAAFIENPFNLPCVNHLNGIKHDNKPSNLEWCDQSMNERHAYRTGLKKPVIAPSRGEANGNAKMSAKDVQFIRELNISRGDRKKLATKFGVHVATIDRILKGDNWI